MDEGRSGSVVFGRAGGGAAYDPSQYLLSVGEGTPPRHSSPCRHPLCRRIQLRPSRDKILDAPLARGVRLSVTCRCCTSGARSRNALSTAISTALVNRWSTWPGRY